MRMNDGLQPELRVTFTAEADACTEECDGSKNVSAVPELKLVQSQNLNCNQSPVADPRICLLLSTICLSMKV